MEKQSSVRSTIFPVELESTYKVFVFSKKWPRLRVKSGKIIGLKDWLQIIYLLVTAISGVYKTSQTSDFERWSCHTEEAFLADVELEESANAVADWKSDRCSGFLQMRLHLGSEDRRYSGLEDGSELGLFVCDTFGCLSMIFAFQFEIFQQNSSNFALSRQERMHLQNKEENVELRGRQIQFLNDDSSWGEFHKFIRPCKSCS